MASAWNASGGSAECSALVGQKVLLPKRKMGIIRTVIISAGASGSGSSSFTAVGPPSSEAMIRSKHAAASPAPGGEPLAPSAPTALRVPSRVVN